MLVKSVWGVADKPCPPPIAAALGWGGGLRRLGGMGRWRLPARRRENLRALSPGAAIPSPAVALPPIPLSWGAPSTWAASFVKCRAAERPGGQPSGPPQIPKSWLSWTGFRERVEKDRRYGVGEGPGQLEWVVEPLTKWPLTRLGKIPA